MAKRVLIIDDEEDFCELVKANLETAGDFEVDIATESVKGLKIAMKNKPDLILLDINMPGMDGYQVLENLRKDKRTIDLPVIMLTAFDDTESKTRATQLYDDLYVVKPVNAEDLIAKINDVLKRRGTE